MELKIKYAPISLGKLRVWSSLHHSLNSMKDLGMESLTVWLIISIPSCGNPPVSSWYSRFGSSCTRLIHLKKARTLYGLKFCGHAFMLCIKSLVVAYSVAIQTAGRKLILTWGLTCYKTTLFYQQHCKYCSLYIMFIQKTGFSDKDLDELRGIFTDTNLFLLGVTFGITVLHVCFKN